jgi:hypothetical protein
MDKRPQFWSDAEYVRLGRQCVRSAITLLADESRLQMTPIEISMAFRWRVPTASDTTPDQS